MNTVLQDIRSNLKHAMEAEVALRKMGVTSGTRFDYAVAQKTVSRAIISMIPELEVKPDDTNADDIYKLLKKYIKNEKERQLYIVKHITKDDVDGINAADLKKLVNEKIQELGDHLKTDRIRIAELYLPHGPTENEIRVYILANLDLSQFKNKMQAMGQVMKAFPGCDGNFVKKILMSM